VKYCLLQMLISIPFAKLLASELGGVGGGGLRGSTSQIFWTLDFSFSFGLTLHRLFNFSVILATIITFLSVSIKCYSFFPSYPTGIR
jgi:hypothetical protein